jgi:preprotein translocase subunit SecE
VADKDEEGTAPEPTSPGSSSTSPAGSHALGHLGSPRGDEVVEPSGEELAASGYDTAGRDDLADLEGPARVHEPLDIEPDEAEERESDALEPVAAGVGGRGVERARERRPAPTAKNAATPSRDRPAARTGRTGPVSFVRESVGELRKVVYPTGQQLANYFVVVLVFVLFIIAYVSLLDLGLGAAIFRVFS